MKSKLSKFVKISMHTSSDSFLQRIFWKFKTAWNKFLGLILHTIFWGNFSFVILHKLTKFHYLTVFNKMCFIFHEYLKSYNLVISQEQKRKWNRKHFSLFHKKKLTKQTSKNAGDTISKIHWLLISALLYYFPIIY